MNLHDMNWKIWALVAAIGLGTAVEIMKRSPANKSWNRTQLQEPKERPYANNQRTAPALIRPKSAPMILPATAQPAAKVPPRYEPPTMNKDQLAALIAQQNKGTTFEHGADVKDKKKDEGEWEIVVDPKTGKRIKRKKKKNEAKKEEEKKEEPKKVAEDSKDDDEHKADSDSDIDNAITTSITSGRLAPMPRPRPDDAFNSAEEWLRRLLARPNVAETNRFVDHFRKNLVTPEVFYKVVNAMLDDSRPEMKKLAILAAANTSTYPMSFQVLAIASTNAKHDSTVRAKAEEALNAYTDYSRLPVLEKIVKGGANPAATFVALSKLEGSAQKNLGAQTQSTNGNTNGQTTVQQKSAAYQKFITPLTNLSGSSPDSRVKQQASQTLATLKNLLGSTTAAQQLAQQPNPPAQ